MNSVHLPDLCSLCLASGLELRINKNCRNVCLSSQKWIESSGYLSPEELITLPNLNIALLSSLCLPTADLLQLGIVTNVLTLLSFQKDRHGVMECPQFVELWKQLSRTTSLSWQARFKYDLSMWLTARADTLEANEQMSTPTLEEYIVLRRKSSGVKVAFDLTEFAEGLNISDDTLRHHPSIHRLRQDAIDIIAWSSDLASYSRDYYHRRSHNIVHVLIAEFDFTIQAAINKTSRLIQQKLENFSQNIQPIISSSGDARAYAQGLRDWIVGYAHWIYETDKYFGDKTDEVKSLGWIFLKDKEDDTTDSAHY